MVFNRVEVRLLAEVTEKKAQIYRALDAVGRRMRFIRVLNNAALSLIFSSIALLVVHIAIYFLPPTFSLILSSWLLATLLYVLLFFTAVAIGFTAKYDRMSVARHIDDQQNLKDRIATSVSISLELVDHQFAIKIVDDASAVLATLSPKTLIPIKAVSLYWFAALSTLVCCLALAMPISPLSGASSSFRRYILASRQQSTHQESKIKSTTQAPLPVALRSTPPVSESAQHKKSSALAAAAAPLGSETNKTVSKPAGELPPAPTKLVHGNNELAPTLGDKLRQFAGRLSQRPMTSGEQQQAAQSLEKVNQKLDNLQMPKTQHDLSSAASDLRSGQQSQAVVDVKTAAADADREGAIPPHGQTGRSGDAEKGSMSIPERNSASSGTQSTQSKSSGQQEASSGGRPEKGQSGAEEGDGSAKPKFGAARKIDPAKLASPSSSKIANLPISNSSGRMQLQAGTQRGQQAGSMSVVPFSQERNSYRSSSERGGTTEQIPPAYQDVVRKYFSVNPSP